MRCNVAAATILAAAGCADQPTSLPGADSRGTEHAMSSRPDSGDRPSGHQPQTDQPNEPVEPSAPIAPAAPVTEVDTPSPTASSASESSDSTSVATQDSVQASMASVENSNSAASKDQTAPDVTLRTTDDAAGTATPAGSSPAPTMRGSVSAGDDTTSEETATTSPDKFPDAYHALPTLVEEGPQRAVRVSFDDFDLLMIMGLDPVPADVEKSLPERIFRLNGRRIRLRGFMYPPFATEGLRGFVLARDNEICCFGRSPKIYDLVPVELRPGVTTHYIEGRPFDVVGTLHIEPEADDDELFQLFYMDDAIVIE